MKRIKWNCYILVVVILNSLINVIVINIGIIKNSNQALIDQLKLNSSLKCINSWLICIFCKIHKYFVIGQIHE